MTAARPKLEPRLLLEPVHLLALGFGSGLSPVAPGTCGSLVALPFAWILQALGWPVQLAVAVTAIAGGIWICGESARRIGCHDHPGIVWDEIAAMLALSLLIPPGTLWILGAFALFRVFDIAKPWPIRDVDHRLRGGLGIMLDDVMAALYAAVCLRLIEFLIRVA